MPTYEQLGFGQGAALTGDRARTVFGHVMGLVAVTMAFAAGGAYIGRDMDSGGIIFFLLALGDIFALQAVARHGHEQAAVAMLFGLGLLLGIACGAVIDYYATVNPGAVYEAAGSTAVFIGILGAFGYTTRRDLSNVARFAFYAFIAVLVFGLIALFVAIPHSNIIYCVLMLGIFGVFTAFDFQRLSRSGSYASAPLIAASIFLDIFNVFLLLLSLFGGGGSNRR